MRKGTNLTNYSLTQNFGDIERIYKMSFSKPTDNRILQIFSFLKLNNCIKLFKTVPAFFMAICLFLQSLKLRYNNINPLKKCQDNIL